VVCARSSRICGQKRGRWRVAAPLLEGGPGRAYDEDAAIEAAAAGIPHLIVRCAPAVVISSRNGGNASTNRKPTGLRNRQGPLPAPVFSGGSAMN